MHRGALLLSMALTLGSTVVPSATRAEPSMAYRVQEPTYCVRIDGCPRLRRNAVNRARNFCQAEGGVKKGERNRDFNCQQSGIYCVVTGRIECKGRLDPTAVPGVPGSGSARPTRREVTCLNPDCSRFVDHAPGHREEGVHACRAGFVMIGISGLGLDLVCQALESPRLETRIDASTTRQGLLACPAGQFLVGVSEERSHLLCAQLEQRAKREHLQDESGNLGLQVCELDDEQPVFMTGLGGARDKILCATLK